jgi:DNA-binding GntR family transcriptional regulator
VTSGPIDHRQDEDALLLTHEFLAEMLGVQRSTVSTVLRGLQTSGLIEQQRGGINVLDRPGLEHAACECLCLSRFTRVSPAEWGSRGCVCPWHDK